MRKVADVDFGAERPGTCLVRIEVLASVADEGIETPSTETARAGVVEDTNRWFDGERADVVDVVWAAVTTGCHGVAEQLTTDLVAARARVPASQVRLGRLCPRCGGAQHGRPVVVSPRRTGLHLSLSRTTGIVAAAACRNHPVGVDVERVGSTRFEAFAEVALHPAESDGPPQHRARMWTRKEALLKAVGLGIAWGPERLDVGPAHQTHGRVDGLRADGLPVWWTDLELGTGYAGAVAVAAPEAPAVIARRADAGA